MGNYGYNRQRWLWRGLQSTSRRQNDCYQGWKYQKKTSGWYDIIYDSEVINYVAFNFGGRNIGGFTGKFGLFLSISWFWIEPWVLFYWNESGREQGCSGRSRLDGPSSGPESWRAWNSLTAQDKVSPAHLGIPGRKINTAAETILHPSNIFIMDIVNGGQGGFLDLRF